MSDLLGQAWEQRAPDLYGALAVHAGGARHSQLKLPAAEVPGMGGQAEELPVLDQVQDQFAWLVGISSGVPVSLMLAEV